MVIRIGDPFAALLGMQRALDNAMKSDWFGNRMSGRGVYPPVNVFRRGDDYVIVAELPGVRKSDLDVTVKGDQVRIELNRRRVGGWITGIGLERPAGVSLRPLSRISSSGPSADVVELARWADLVLVAPATADLMARLAQGVANDLLTTLVLATNAPVALAPAMNQAMWADPATQANRALLEQRGIRLFGPASGSQACGDVGLGRMLEADDLAQAAADCFERSLLTGKHLLITAGPTQENIDPVRYITNHSSGKMGFALAEAAAEAGARVTLVAGPVFLPTPDRVQRIDVVSARDMLAACEAAMPCEIGRAHV